jgi:2'-5' RNA ligase
MRLFAAIELPGRVREALSDWRLETGHCLDRSDWRPVPPHLWHLTLAFYGDVGRDDADDLCEQLAECAGNSDPVHLCTGGFGAFPRPSRPRVFWAGVRDADSGKALKRLAHCCRRAGHATVRKRTAKETAFRGHVTVARARGYPKPLDIATMQMMPELAEISWRADRLCLFQSILQADGPQYRRLETFELKSSRNGTRGDYV